MMENKLIQLNGWHHFRPNTVDIRVMYDSVIQSRYSVVKLVAFVVSRVDWKQTLLSHGLLSFDELLNVVENLSYVTIMLVDQSYITQVDLESIPFIILDPSQVKGITLMLLELMRQQNRDILSVFGEADSPTPNARGSPERDSPTAMQSNESNLFLLKMLKSVCSIASWGSQITITENVVSLDKDHLERIHQITCNRTWFMAKHICYINTITHFLTDRCNFHPQKVVTNLDQIRSFLVKLVEELKSTFVVLTSSERITLFKEFMEMMNEVSDDAIRHRLCVYYATIFSYLSEAKLVADLIIATQQTVKNVRNVCYLLECFIENYLDLATNGVESLDFLVDNLKIVHLQSSRSNQQLSANSESDPAEYVSNMLQSKTSLLIILHIYGRLRKSTVPEVCVRKNVCTLISSCGSFKLT